MDLKNAELALDRLLAADWWDHDSAEIAIERTDDHIIVWATTEIYFISWGGAITRHIVSAREVVHV